MQHTVTTQLQKGQTALPATTPTIAKQPIMAARTTDGEVPTNATKPIIIIIVSNPAIRLLIRNPDRVLATNPESIEILAPESATMWSVPVETRAS
jgi:ATP-dependent helicase YprA (DUF1998 family)